GNTVWRTGVGNSARAAGVNPRKNVAVTRKSRKPGGVQTNVIRVPRRRRGGCRAAVDKPVLGWREARGGPRGGTPVAREKGQPNRARTGRPVLTGRVAPSGLRRVSGSTPSAEKSVAAKSSGVTGRSLT